jgi:hypothetical protein
MMSKEEHTKREEEEPCVRVFVPGVSEPYEYDGDSDTAFVVKQISEERRVKGHLKKRNTLRTRVGTTTLKAGDYDFCIADQTSGW